MAFLVANLAFALALVRASGLSRLVGWFYAAASVLTGTLILGEFGTPYLPAWIYPAIQPLARALIGAWLWRNADESRNLGDFDPQRPT